VPNNFALPNWVALKILWFLKNSLEVAAQFNTDWEAEFTKSFPVGSQVQIPIPQSWLVTDGLGYQPQGINRLVTTLNLDQIFGIHFEWDSYEKLVALGRTEEELDEAYFLPAGAQLAQEADTRAANWATLYTSNVVGTLGTDATTLSPYTAAERRLFEKACPVTLKRHMCVSPSLSESYIKNNVTSQFNPSKDVSDMFRKGVIGTIAGSTFYRSNSLFKQTAGTIASTLVVTGANQSGNALIVTGSNGDTINAGDKFSIASVNGVNPRTRRAGSMGLQHFTVAQNYVLTGGNDTININPPIYGPGSQYQNVDSLPTNGAAITMWPGTASPNGKAGLVSLLLTKYAFLMAGGKFDNPKAVEKAEMAEDDETGLSIAYVRAWDQKERKTTSRYDCCLGFGLGYQDNGAVAVAGA